MENKKVNYRIRAAGFNKNFNWKGGGDNGEQPMEGLKEVALLYTESCPERLPAEGDLFTPEAGSRSAIFNR